MNCLPELQRESKAARWRQHVLPSRERASVLIIVMWVAFGLVSVALYFAQSMIFELRASDNRVAELEAEQAIEGAARYVNYVLANSQQPGTLPDLQTYQHDAVPVGDATFWFIGRTDQQVLTDEPYFSLVDEASKLNLNTATVDMLQKLPRMTPELAAAIVDWRDSDDNVTPSGAETDTYSRLRPPYKCKNAPFETVDELRLVVGAELEILYGEDSNLNGILDLNENDGNVSPPDDNRDGHLDPGIFEYVTVYSREPNVQSDGSKRVSVTDSQALARLLQQQFGAQRANQVLGRGRGANYSSVLEFYIASGMTADEFEKVQDALTASNGQYVEGLVNVNTASEAVLACIPGIGTEKAPTLVAQRRSNPQTVATMAWVKDVLDHPSAKAAGPFLTGRTYQFSADIAAVGHHGRGYRRTRFIFDTSEGTPRIRYRQDLSHLGWALGRQTRQRLLLANNSK